MHITIHRGISQIGGCITEIATRHTRIIIDLGGNLPSNDGAVDPLANPEAVAQLTRGVDAIFYTHYHGDHVSLWRFVPELVPQYIGEDSLKIMRIPIELLSHLQGGQKTLQSLSRMRTYRTMQPVEVGDIRVTPFLTSHSAFDAHMLLVEADGKRILHTGDFRGHGYLSRPLWDSNPQKNLLKKYIAPADILITEGTMLSRAGRDAMPEAMLKDKAAAQMRQHKCVFVLCSSTDVDRLSSFFRAAQEASRLFVCDKYQGDIIDKVREVAGSKGPYYRFRGKTYTFLHPQFAMNSKQLQYMNDKGFCLLARKGYYKRVEQLVDYFGRENCLLLYSMWSGYYDGSVPSAVDSKIIAFRNLFDAQNIVYLHTSGHATTATLENFIRTLSPREAIVGIHKDAKASLTMLNLPDSLRQKIVPERISLPYIEIR